LRYASPAVLLPLLLSSFLLAQADAGSGVLTKAPTLVRQVDPVFPAARIDAGVGGDVTLELELGTDGTVTDARVAESAGADFDDAALTAVRQFLFTPAEIDGAPAAVRIAFTLHFLYRPPEPEPLALDDRNLHAELRRADRGDITAGAGTDDNEIELRH
jgi:TonB family protein